MISLALSGTRAAMNDLSVAADAAPNVRGTERAVWPETQ